MLSRESTQSASHLYSSEWRSFQQRWYMNKTNAERQHGRRELWSSNVRTCFTYQCRKDWLAQLHNHQLTNVAHWDMSPQELEQLSSILVWVQKDMETAMGWYCEAVRDECSSSTSSRNVLMAGINDGLGRRTATPNPNRKSDMTWNSGDAEANPNILHPLTHTTEQNSIDGPLVTAIQVPGFPLVFTVPFYTADDHHEFSTRKMRHAGQHLSERALKEWYEAVYEVALEFQRRILDITKENEQKELQKFYNEVFTLAQAKYDHWVQEASALWWSLEGSDCEGPQEESKTPTPSPRPFATDDEDEDITPRGSIRSTPAIPMGTKPEVSALNWGCVSPRQPRETNIVTPQMPSNKETSHHDHILEEQLANVIQQPTSRYGIYTPVAATYQSTKDMPQQPGPSAISSNPPTAGRAVHKAVPSCDKSAAPGSAQGAYQHAQISSMNKRSGSSKPQQAGSGPLKQVRYAAEEDYSSRYVPVKPETTSGVAPSTQNQSETDINPNRGTLVLDDMELGDLYNTRPLDASTGAAASTVVPSARLREDIRRRNIDGWLEQGALTPVRITNAVEDVGEQSDNSFGTLSSDSNTESLDTTAGDICPPNDTLRPGPIVPAIHTPSTPRGPPQRRESLITHPMGAGIYRKNPHGVDSSWRGSFPTQTPDVDSIRMHGGRTRVGTAADGEPLYGQTRAPVSGLIPSDSRGSGPSGVHLIYGVGRPVWNTKAPAN
ncbi:hypothetical protein BDQ12DRAFT_733198 [Crucibulum laeve]|uniref:Uncharacterized protein n=1 Tax=Crucibulum laeve TaxID=68775 RepID=A0A5C3M8J3_9AGAR|nr:hypothetical protein BDQ12DRAFT_733198 [Crucibulum laeve]